MRPKIIPIVFAMLLTSLTAHGQQEMNLSEVIHTARNCINKIESTYTLIGYMCNKNGKVCGSSIIGTSQSFFDREFEYAKIDISKH